MSEINYQALREVAERAIPAMERLLMLPADDDLLSEQELKDYGVDIDALNAFKFLTGPETVLALLDERERNLQYIKSRDQENEEIALTVGKLRVELEAAKSKLNEQREYYEGVISDGGKRIAELEKSEEQLINERDHAESALADMYFAATGDRPEWSNCFSFSDAVDAVVDRIADLEAKQPSPVVPDNASEPLAYAYKELTPEIMRNHLAVFERYGIAPNDSSTTIQALRIALDGIERSDAMLHGAEPVSQAHKLNALDGNSPVTPDSWISCSERMPKKNQNVLISVNFDSDLVEPLICSARYTGSTFRRGDATIKPGNGIEQATHWMPLPEPPQEVK